MFSFATQAFVFFKICEMVICPVRVTYNHVVYFLLKKEKQRLNKQMEQHLRFAKSLICSKFYISLENYTFLVRWGDVQSAVNVTTRFIRSAELTRSTKILCSKKPHKIKLEAVV